MAHRIGSLVGVGVLGVVACGCDSDSYGGSPTTPSSSVLVSMEDFILQPAP